MEDVTAQRVGATVRAEIARRKISQVTLAGALGISQAAVSRRLNGAVPFDVHELNRVAVLLDLPLAVLVGEGVAA